MELAASVQLAGMEDATYVRVGRSLYLSLNWTNCVKKGIVWLVVPMAMALARVPMTAITRNMRSEEQSMFLAYINGGMLETNMD